LGLAFWFLFCGTHSFSPKPQPKDTTTAQTSGAHQQGAGSKEQAASSTEQSTLAARATVASANDPQSNIPVKVSTIETDLFKVELDKRRRSADLMADKKNIKSRSR